MECGSPVQMAGMVVESGIPPQGFTNLKIYNIPVKDVIEFKKYTTEYTATNRFSDALRQLLDCANYVKTMGVFATKIQEHEDRLNALENTDSKKEGPRTFGGN